MHWDKQRFEFKPQIELSKKLAYPDLPEYKELNRYFEAELATYIDLNADLKLVDSDPHDGRVELYCGVLQQASDLSKVRVHASQRRSRFDLDYRPDAPYFLPTIAKKWISPGLVHVYFSRGQLNAVLVVIFVEIDRSHYGAVSGAFMADMPVKGKDLW